jgi:hypothetical protein
MPQLIRLQPVPLNPLPVLEYAHFHTPLRQVDPYVPVNFPTLHCPAFLVPGAVLKGDSPVTCHPVDGFTLPWGIV